MAVNAEIGVENVIEKGTEGETEIGRGPGIDMIVEIKAVLMM